MNRRGIGMLIFTMIVIAGCQSQEQATDQSSTAQEPTLTEPEVKEEEKQSREEKKENRTTEDSATGDEKRDQLMKAANVLEIETDGKSTEELKGELQQKIMSDPSRIEIVAKAVGIDTANKNFMEIAMEMQELIE